MKRSQALLRGSAASAILRRPPIVTCHATLLAGACYRFLWSVGSGTGWLVTSPWIYSRRRRRSAGHHHGPGARHPGCQCRAGRNARSGHHPAHGGPARQALLHYPRLDFVRTNVEGTLHLLEACVAHSIPKLLYTSTTSIYGQAMAHPDQVVWVAENLVPRPATSTTSPNKPLRLQAFFNCLNERVMRCSYEVFVPLQSEALPCLFNNTQGWRGMF
jgi:NAD dependent epimerase/dehydratase family